MRKLTISILPVFIFMMSAVFSYAQFMHKPQEDRVCMGKYAPVSTEAVTSIFYEDFSGADFPPAGWTVMGDGLTNWIAANSGSAGGTAPEAQFYWNPNFVGVSRLVTPEISTSGYSEVLLSLKHFLDDYGLAGDYTLYIETTSDGGTTWNPVWSLVDPGADVGPGDLYILIDNGDVGSDNFQLAFTFDGDSYELNWWNFDNIDIMEALSYDAEATSLLVPSLVGAGDAVTPIGIVSNKGSQTISFDVVVEILENGTSVYSETMSVTSLPSFETETLTFPQWNSYEGNFVVEMTTLLSGDENPDNDMLSKDLEALAGVIFIKPLYEEFTSSTCGPCASANPILDAILQANPGTHSLIKYQMDWPGSGDPYYTEEGGVRKDYYGVSYVPDMYINADQHYPGDMTQALYDSYIGIPTALTIDIVTAEIDENYNITVEANIDVASNYAAGLTAHIVVVEKVTVGNALSNGETEFFNVMMKMLPDAGGTTLPALNPGNTTTLSESYDMSLTFMEQPNDLAVVIFVQDDSDKSIIQSETADVAGEFDAFDVTIIVEDEDGAAIMGAEVFLEGNGTLTSNASGEVLFDGVFPGSYAYEIVAAGFYDASGDLEVIDQNVTVTVTMITPDFFWFEMFDEGIPADWTMHFSGWDYLYWYDGKVIFFRQSGTDNPLMLVSPLIDISTADMLYFDLGETNGTPPVVFGTVTDPSDPDSFTELETYYPGADWETYEFDLTTLNGGESEVYLAWKLSTTDFSFFSFDNVIITAGGSGGEYCLDGLYVTGCSFGDGLVYWDFADVNIPNIACDGVPYIWYHDWTNEVHHVTAGMDYVLTVEGGYGGEHLYVWVDLNEDYYMSEDELLVNEWVLEEGGVPYQTTITIPADAPLGQFTVRFRTNWETPIPESCFGVNFGNMADFTIEISEGGSSGDCEDFDDLTVGGYVAEQLGGMWTTWSNAPGTGEDAMVTDAMSNSPSNSFIVAPNVDMIYKFDDAAITTGMAAYSHYMYVASGTTGYFNVQSDPTPGVAWVIELYFNDGGAGQFIVDAVTTDFTYTQDVWFMVEVMFDLDADAGEVWFDGTLVHSFTTANSIGGIDYFGAAATDAGHYDDVCFETGGVPPTLEPPTNLTAEVILDDVHLEWEAPAGTGGDLIEIAYDDGTAEANWWISVPSTADDMMAKRLTMPEDGTIQEIAFFTYSPAGESFNDIIVCADNGSGQPNLAAAYENFGVTTPPFITGDWLFLTLSSPFALSAGEDFWIVANWQGGNNNGPFIGGDQTVPPTENRNYWSNVPGTWNLWTSDRWMMRAYYSAPGESYDGSGLQVITHMNDKNISLPVSATTNPVAFEGTQSWKAPTIITGAKALNGYNVYRDGSMIGYTTFEFYDDMDLDPGSYDYYVTAVYDEGESDPSNTATAVVEEIISEECEYFDDLTVGGYVAEQLGGFWTTWSNAPGTAEDAIVTDAQSYSASNSFIVDPNVDMIFQFGNNPITTGAWLYSNMMYIPSGKTGYFNVQSEPTPGVAWVIELYFNDGGAGQVIVDAVTTDFTYPQDEWIWVGVNIDLDNDAGDFWINDDIIHSFVTANSIGGIDYFGAAATDGAYYDDVCFGEGYTIEPPVLPAPTDLTAEAVGEDIELNWTAPAGPVGSLLVVDRDGSADLAFTDDWQFIQPALDALGTDYTYFEVTDLTTDGPDLATMQEHDMILWLCGEGWQQSQTMSSNDENNLEAYLDGGGNLFISGHDYLWDKYPSAGAFSPGQFPYDYLGVASVVQDTWFISSPSTASASGVNGSFGEGITFSVADIYTTDKDGLYIDQLTALDAGLFQVTSPAPTGVGAVQFDGGGFRTAFTTLSIAAITDQSDIEEVLAAAFGWFSAGDSDELLGYNIYHNLNGGAFSLLGNTTSTQYTHTAPGIGTHCYYVTAVYDEGESDPSNTDCETLTGIENYLSSQVQVYPNPAKDAVHIQSDGEIQSIVVYNFSGQVAYEKEVHSTHFTINVSQFNPGVYLFRIRTDGETITQRIVVE